MRQRPSRASRLAFLFPLLLALSAPAPAWAQGWQVQALPPLPAGQAYNPASVSATSPTHVWVAGHITPSYDTFVARSTDGGITWSLVSREAGRGVSRLRMLTATDGYVAGVGLFKSTTDGGATWVQEQNALCCTPPSPVQLHNVGPDGHVYGFAVGAAGRLVTVGYDGYSAGVIHQRNPDRPHLNANVNAPWWLVWAQDRTGMYGADMATSATGWAVGANATVLKTADGGATWAPQTAARDLLHAQCPAGQLGCEPPVHDVDAVDASTAWAVASLSGYGGPGLILKTTDGGATWALQATNAAIIRRVAAVDATTAWAVGDGGLILRTTDGGATWTRQWSGTASTLTDVEALSATTAWVAAADGSILATTDGGTGTWPVPTITGVSPAKVALDGGTAVTITGTGFRAGALAVTFGTLAADAVTWVSPTTVRAVAPSFHVQSGGGWQPLLTPQPVTLTNEDGGAATLPGAVTPVRPPRITGFSPLHGPAAGAHQVTIDGFFLGTVNAAQLSISFPDPPYSSLESLPVTVVSGTRVVVSVPASATRRPGKGTIVLKTPEGPTAEAGDFVLDPGGGVVAAIDAVSPGQMTRAVWTPVTITGTGFGDTSGFWLCGSDATITARSSTQLTGTVRCPDAGWHELQVSFTDAASVSVRPGVLVLASGTSPVVTQVSPAGGGTGGGTPVTIAGTGLAESARTMVLFGDAPATVVSRTATSLSVLTPAHAPGAVDVTVIPTDGSDDQVGPAAIAAAAFTFADVPPAPTITSLYPAAGHVQGGTLVTIKGTGFAMAPLAAAHLASLPAGAVPTVTIGGAPSTLVAIVDATTITCRAPALAAGSARDVVVTWPGGAQASAPAAYMPMDPAAAAGHDADADTMPDDWEILFGLDPTTPADAALDSDGDGRTNAQERAAGTHPDGHARRYFAEGATTPFFDTSIALANPLTIPASVHLRFLRRDGVVVTHALRMRPTSRATVDPKALSGMNPAEFATTIESDQVIAVDRTMRWAGGSHAERSLPEAATTWYLAEGATHSGFDLFYLLQNPTATAAEVRVRYLLPGGAPLEKRYVVEPNSRANIWVDNEQFPEGSGALALADTDVSAVIEVLNGVPIIAERAMYLSRGGQPFLAGHESAGVTAPALEWFLAEGATGPFFDLFILLANPSATDAQVEVRYLLSSGQVVRKTYVVAAQSRFNIWVDLEDQALADAAVSTALRVTNGVPIIVERAMWWPGSFAAWTEAHNSPGSTVTGTLWMVAEGEVGGAAKQETYLLVANTSATDALIDVTLLLEDGTTATRRYTVAANSRFNVPVGIEFAEARDRRFGALVESVGATPAQIVVERAMYNDEPGVPWASGSNALATRVRD